MAKKTKKAADDADSPNINEPSEDLVETLIAENRKLHDRVKNLEERLVEVERRPGAEAPLRHGRP